MPVATPIADIALTSLSAVKVYLGIPSATTTYDARITAIILYVSDRIKRYCDDNFIAETHELRLDGNGKTELLLDNQPIIQVDQVSIGILGLLNVINDDTTARQAFVKVTTNGIVLTIEGGTNAGTDTINLTTYPTIQTAADVITAIGKGWAGTVISTDYALYPSADLFSEDTNKECLDSNVVLYAPGDALSDYILYPDEGKIYYYGGFPKGNKNIFIQYRTGYVEIPGDLELATIELVVFMFSVSKSDLTLSSERLGDHAWTKGDGISSGSMFDGLLESKLARFRNFFITS